MNTGYIIVHLEGQKQIAIKESAIIYLYERGDGLTTIEVKVGEHLRSLNVINRLVDIMEAINRNMSIEQASRLGYPYEPEKSQHLYRENTSAQVQQVSDASQDVSQAFSSLQPGP